MEIKIVSPNKSISYFIMMVWLLRESFNQSQYPVMVIGVVNKNTTKLLQSRSMCVYDYITGVMIAPSILSHKASMEYCILGNRIHASHTCSNTSPWSSLINLE